MIGGVHAFFYLWYGEPTTDGGEYRHWNHEVLPHWTEATRQRFPHGAGTRFRPPVYIHSPFYPARGPYSSRNGTVLRAQFQEMREHGIDVAVLSWWGRPTVQGTHDTQGVSTDDAVPTVLNAASAAGLHIAFHLEPYAGRSARSVRDDVAYIAHKYGDHPALLRALPPPGRRHRLPRGGAADHSVPLPVYYVYDSYHIEAREWAAVLGPPAAASRQGQGQGQKQENSKSPASLRGTDADGVFIGLWLERAHGVELARAGFDGAYSYFASDGFSYGATSANWAACAATMRDKGLFFVPSVGPGYNDVRIRPWNAHNTKARRGTQYYDDMWRAALDTGVAPEAVSITSYNEWGEGTQIEPAAPKVVSEDEHATAVAQGDDVDANSSPGRYDDILRKLGIGRRYLDYAPAGPTAFLERTLHWAGELKRLVNDRSTYGKEELR